VHRYAFFIGETLARTPPDHTDHPTLQVCPLPLYFL
jgi:hypothetical protein